MARSSTAARASPRPDAGDREFLRGLSRAAAGALVFAIPMLMTMEMWWLGFEVSPLRLGVLLAAMLPILVGLSRYGGFRETSRLSDDVADALVALLVGAVVSALALWLFGLLGPGMSAREMVGKVIIQAGPASLGAMLARSQLRGGHERPDPSAGAQETYWTEIFLMGVGALFLSLNLAPTEEMVLIAYKMNVWREIGLALLSIGVIHAFVYSVNFRGGSSRDPDVGFLSIFARFAVVGYALVLLVSLAVLWIFGRTDSAAGETVLSAAVVLSFPGAVGAAAARLLL